LVKIDTMEVLNRDTSTKVPPALLVDAIGASA
jgi:hypothetical protein